MTRRTLLASRLTPLAAATLLAACGGGGGSAPQTSGPQPVSFSGVAATGAPLAAAAVKVTDARGTDVCTTTTDSDGRYTCALAAGATAPFALTARKDDQTLVSVAAQAATSIVNLTPLTTLVVARLVPTGDPAALAAAIRADPAVAAPEKVQAKVDEVKAVIAPLLSAVGDNLNPISGSFSADGRGHDKVLDSLQVSIRPAGASSNIEVTVKVRPDSDAAAPVRSTFSSDAAVPPPITTTINPAALVPDGTAPLISGYFQRMAACYALPLAQRISGVAANATSATGTAANVQAAECRTLFLDDDPATYKDNGFVVGSAGGFPGLFRESSTGARFDRGNFEYRRANGDVVVTFRSTTLAGAVAFSMLTLREQGGRLKAIGNQYAYDAVVRPYVVERDFLLRPDFGYVATGWMTFVANRIDPLTQQPLFAEVRVTAPDGTVLTLRPQAGRSFLGLVRPNGSNSGSSVQVFAAAFKDPQTSGNPAERDPAAFLFSPARYSEEALRSIADQGVWTYEFVHADPSRPNVIQHERTIARTPTLGEARSMASAQPTQAFRAELLARPEMADGRGVVFGPPVANAPGGFRIGTADGGDGWTLPDGAAGVTSINIFGSSATGQSFNDSVATTSLERKAVVFCSKQSLGDTHCDSTLGTTQFSEGSRLFTLEWFGRDARFVSRVRHLALYRPVL